MPMDSTRTFATRGLPWGSHHCNTHWVTPGPRWRSRAHADVEDMLKQIAWLKKQPGVLDVYVCMSSQTISDVRVSASGYEFRTGVRSKANAHSLRSLFIDVDVKVGAYAITEDALHRALEEIPGGSQRAPARRR